MSKLAKFLQELKENRETGNPPFRGSNQKKPIPKFALGLLISLFILSIVVGYYLPKFFQNKKEFPQEKRIPPEQVVRAPSNMTTNETENKESHNKSAHAANQTKEEGRLTISKKPKASAPPTPSKEVRNQTIEKKDDIGKKGKKEIDKGLKTGKEMATQALTISPSGEPPLRSKELASNLLLNAEEERKRGNYDEAIRLYYEYLKFKEDPNVLNNLGALYLLKGDYKRAETLFERALNIKKDPLYEINYYITLLKQGRVEAVCKELKHKEYPAHLRDHLRDHIEFIKTFCR